MTCYLGDDEKKIIGDTCSLIDNDAAGSIIIEI